MCRSFSLPVSLTLIPYFPQKKKHFECPGLVFGYAGFLFLKKSM